MSWRKGSLSFSSEKKIETADRTGSGLKGEIMCRYHRSLAVFVTLAMGLLLSMSAAPAIAASADEIDRGVDSALQDLYSKYPSAKVLAEKAKGVLVFPNIIKGGFIVGGLYGEGALRKGSQTAGYYNTVAASYGLQAGLQKYGYALFFMTDSTLKYLERSDGWELGVGPNITVVDAGMAKSLSTTTLKSEVYAFFFSQKGLMAGLGLQGSKVTRLSK
jgi:lipid-binding SYLF domain-containing protein